MLQFVEVRGLFEAVALPFRHAAPGPEFRPSWVGHSSHVMSVTFTSPTPHVFNYFVFTYFMTVSGKSHTK